METTSTQAIPQLCPRCATRPAGLPRPPFRGALGEELQRRVCPTCWEDWKRAEVMVINELKLNFMEPSSQEILTSHMREFLGLDGIRGAWSAVKVVPEAPRSLRGPAVKFAILLLLVVGGFLAARYTPLSEYLKIEKIQGYLDQVRGLWWAPAALVGTIVVLGSLGLPATPFIVAGAAIFGAIWGTVWNWVGIFLSSLTGFLLARLLGREFVERIGGDKLGRAEKLLHRRGFMPLIAIRFLPVPFTLVNAAAAVVGVKLPKFLLASAIGLLPPIAILTYFSSALLEAATGDRAAIVRQALMVSITAALCVFLPIGIRRRLRKRKAKRLRALRAARPVRRGPVAR